MATKGKQADPSFEKALEELEGIIESLESGEAPLNELVTRFEKGNQLLKVCQNHLKSAELKISQIQGMNDGEPILAPFENS
ncbi:MAG TPA: exodeoxyribonuclease VII small subunit [Opitutae bacterium]|nr:exodeoxyribonuclease VII small subunit [Opitutae bacterium]|tara:strand:+ start:1784 stop:2026 length:243 start_codon:yes stop_codon:yes gene_type:complete